MNLANRLTMLRLVLASAVFASMLAESFAAHLAALGLFLAAVATDWLDGWLARRMNIVSAFGKIIDPIADKILVLGTLLALLRHKDLDIPVWAVFLLIMRELLVGGLRVLAAANNRPFSADRWAKVKTAIQCVAVLLMLFAVNLRDRGLSRPWMLSAAGPLTILCAVLAWSSLLFYFREYRTVLEKSWS